MKLTRVNLTKLICREFAVNGAGEFDGELTVSQHTRDWVKSFTSRVLTLRVYFYDGREIGSIVDEVADINTITDWLKNLEEVTTQEAAIAKNEAEDKAFWAKYGDLGSDAKCSTVVGDAG